MECVMSTKQIWHGTLCEQKQTIVCQQDNEDFEQTFSDCIATKLTLKVTGKCSD